MSRTLVVFALLLVSLSMLTAVTITGKVVDADGKPVANALLWLGWMDGTQGQDLRADAQGAFSVTFDDAHEIPLAPGLLLAYAPGYALGLGCIYNREVKCITVQPATSLSGTVISEDGKPLAGVTVCDGMQKREVFYPAIPASWRARYTATTDATGRWVLPNELRDGDTWVTIDDERYVREDRLVKLTDGHPVAPVQLTAHPAGAVHGRVLDPDGQPATDAWVELYTPKRHSAIILPLKADGTFRFVGLAPAKYLLRIESRGNRWVVDDIDNIVVRANKTTTLPDVHAHTGAILEGDVLDADNGTPLPFVSITCIPGANRDPHSMEYSATADAHGHFLCHVPPVKMQVIAEHLPEGYYSQTLQDATTVELQEGKTRKITLKPRKGVTFTGTVTDENGTPVSNVALNLSITDRFNMRITSDKDGRFTVKGLPMGNGTLDLAWYDPPKLCEWEQETPLKFTLPVNGPITVPLRHLSPCTVRGRVVDIHLQPLSGVTVSLDACTQFGGVVKTFTAVTDADGYYQLEKIPTSTRMRLRTLQKAGYRQSTTEMELKAGQGTVDDVKMVAGNISVSGVVRTPDGKPVKGAVIISVETGLGLRAVTDANGAFTLTEQPEGQQLHLIAATRTGSGAITITDTKNNTIICPPGIAPKPRDVQFVASLLNADAKLPQEQRVFRRADAIRLIADIDLPLANKLAAVPDAQPSDGLRAYLLGKLAAAQAAKVGKTQLEQITNDVCRIYAAVELGIAVAQRDPALAEYCYQQAKASYARTQRIDEYMDIDGLGGMVRDPAVRIIALAEVLKKTADLDAMLTQLSVQIKQRGSYGIVGALLEAAALVSPEFVFTVYDRINSLQKQYELNSVVSMMAQSDPAGARRLVQMINEKQLDLPTVKIGIRQTVNALGKSDPAAALALANELPAREDKCSALLLAAGYQPKAEGMKILRDCFADEKNITAANLARASVVDAESARTLYDNNRKRFEAEIAQGHGHLVEKRLNYAYAITALDPVEARLIIETEYAHAAMHAEEKTVNMLHCGIAMVGIDLTRAQAMLGPTKMDPQTRAGVNNYYSLLSSMERVASLPFDRNEQ